MSAHQEIKCNVHSCKYNDKTRACTLHDIVVGQCCDNQAKSKDQTECVSFEAE